MENQVYIQGIGLCQVITVNKINQDGINEPYDIYQPIEK